MSIMHRYIKCKRNNCFERVQKAGKYKLFEYTESPNVYNVYECKCKRNNCCKKAEKAGKYKLFEYTESPDVNVKEINVLKKLKKQENIYVVRIQGESQCLFRRAIAER